jgi:hypothetical protein
VIRAPEVVAGFSGDVVDHAVTADGGRQIRIVEVRIGVPGVLALQ